MKFEPVIKWSGSKRILSEQIIKYFPKTIDTYYEPFCGSCSIMFQLLHSNIKINNYICSDINNDVITFFNIIKNNPNIIYEEYNKRWITLISFKEIKGKQIYYNQIRDNYNKTKNIHDFVFLTRTSINGLIRYNSKGEFNAPFHLTRNGIQPDRFKQIIFNWNKVINKNNIKFICQDYKKIVPNYKDYIFLDPPYENSSKMYFGKINIDEFWNWLKNIKCNYALTFNGKRTNVDNTYSVPKNLYNNHIYLDSKISGFKKFHKQKDYVQESLYIK